MSLAAALIDVVFGAHRRLDADALSLSRPPAVRRHRRSAVRAADGGRRHRARRRSMRRTAGSARRWRELGVKVAFTPLGHSRRADLRRPAVRRAHRPADHRGTRARSRRRPRRRSARSRWQTIWRVVLPPLTPALLTGMALAFARGVGEYGSVIFIAGNVAYVSEIAPLLDRRQARGIRLRRRDRDRRDHARRCRSSCCSRSTAAQAWTRRRLGHV